ncbi:hypothetical protein LCGC14_1725720 [marine sediment metagenome]|uniref:SWIM-type domain-containing protein n=1 Tax=marine sediment metagenome TaxID=412755 RepID=A0A0F9JRR6_9ZZZZ
MGKAHYNPSALMSAYNYARHWAKRTGLTDTSRVDRAFGYLQTGEAMGKWREYNTTVRDCNCPDRRVRGNRCKHSLSKMIHIKHQQLMAEFLEITPEEFNEIQGLDIDNSFGADPRKEEAHASN